jgi:carbamoyl-phosphate synthase large subunit
LHHKEFLLRKKQTTPNLCLPLAHLQCQSQDEQPYIIEANPRASRTVPFVAKAVGHPIAKYASLLMSGKTLNDIGFTEVRY